MSEQPLIEGVQRAYDEDLQAPALGVCSISVSFHRRGEFLDMGLHTLVASTDRNFGASTFYNIKTGLPEQGHQSAAGEKYGAVGFQ